jgi:hypothetical protein
VSRVVPERGREVVAAWATPSTHGAAVYETLLYADGQLSCNCPAWVYARKGRPRGCRHTRAAESQGADRLAGREPVVGSEPSRPTPRGPAVTSRLTGRPLRRFDVS